MAADYRRALLTRSLRAPSPLRLIVVLHAIMESMRGAEAGGSPGRLSQLYTDATQSYRSAIPNSTADDVPELQSANRKFRMQKDRLVAWGLEWADSSYTPERAIGETVERAGLTELVSSIMENIIGMIDEVEQLRLRIRPAQSHPSFPLDKARWDVSDIAHYNDLVNDITKANDLLCSLSNPRRPPSRDATLARGHITGFNQGLSDYEASKASEELAKALQSQEDPSSATAQRIDRSMLIMPEEASPPYDSFGMPCPVQIVGRMRTKSPYRDFKGQEHYEATTPVLVEYARYDPIYQGGAIPLPFTRLNQLSNILANALAKRPTSLLSFAGYFEDSSLPRIGLVYELPQWAQCNFFEQPASIMKPASLHSLLQTAAQASPTPAAPVINPALEDRFVLANELVSGFSHLFDRGFAHKDVNSTSVTFFPGPPTEQQSPSKAASGISYLVRKPAICAFDLFSEYDIDRERENLHQNMYRHPDDPRIRGPATSDEHHPRFDMYSLALLLLEIGLWVPLAKMFKVKYSLKDFGLRLRKIYIPRLASECGSIYMKAVQELIDISIDDQISDKTSKDAFSRIIARLQKCCLIDEADSEEHPPAAFDPGSGGEPKMYTYHLSEKHPIPEPAELPGPVYHSESVLPLKPKSAPFDSEPVSDTDTSGAPPGAWPETPVFPDYEITRLGSGAIVKRAFKPVRYFFPQCPILRAVYKEAYRIEKRLCKIGERILDPKESASISLDGFGESESVAKPTFCVMCSSTAKFYKAVKKNLAFDENMFDLIIFQGAVARSKAFAHRASARRSNSSSAEPPAKNPGHHLRPLCGASIGAWKDYEHLPPVSFGGVIMVDGEPFGMSVHHMLEPPDDGDEDERVSNDDMPDIGTHRSAAHYQPPQTAADFATEFASADDEDDISDSMSEAESITFSDIDDEEDDAVSVSSPSQRYPPLPTPNFADGDTPGISMVHGSDIMITQPALDDIPQDFFPVEEDKDDDHLSSHTLGHIHASSGIRRCIHNGVEHEIDWALMRLDDRRLQPHNVVAGGRRHCRTLRPPRPATSRRNNIYINDYDPPPLLDPVCRRPYAREDDLYPTSILPCDDMANLGVHSVGRTSGLATGRTGGFMEFVKMAGRRTWSESWTVRAEPGAPLPNDSSLGRLGVAGDSGAWIIDNQSGKVCGHVLAFSQAKQCAYIAPMEILLQDIKTTLGVQQVYLPGSEITLATHALGTVSNDVRQRGEQQSMTEELSRLRVGGSEEERRSHRLLTQHFSLTGRQTHLEKEWAARRAALGSEYQAGG